jgi:hypothetical protein
MYPLNHCCAYFLTLITDIKEYKYTYMYTYSFQVSFRVLSLLLFVLLHQSLTKLNIEKSLFNTLIFTRSCCYICIFRYLYVDSLMPLAGLYFCVGLCILWHPCCNLLSNNHHYQVVRIAHVNCFLQLTLNNSI